MPTGTGAGVQGQDRTIFDPPIFAPDLWPAAGSGSGSGTGILRAIGTGAGRQGATLAIWAVDPWVVDPFASKGGAASGSGTGSVAAARRRGTGGAVVFGAPRRLRVVGVGDGRQAPPAGAGMGWVDDLGDLALLGLDPLGLLEDAA